MSVALTPWFDKFLVERHIGVAVDGGDDGGLLAGRSELLDVGHDGLPIGMAEWRVVDHDVLGLHALRLQISLEDFVGRARIDIIGAGQHPALHLLFLGEVIDRGDRLLVGRGARVEDVALALLTLVLDGVEQDAVELLEDREHGFARHGGPAAEDRHDLVLADQLAGFLRKERPVRRRIDDDGFELLAEDAAFLVLLFDQHEHGVLQRRLADRHGSRERMQHADLDRLLRMRRTQQAGGQRHRGGQQPRFLSRPVRKRHRCLLVQTAPEAAEQSKQQSCHS